jgi:hypothetical protein
MEARVPLPDKPMSGFLNVENAPSIRPGDIIRVDEDGNTKEAHEVLSVREESGVITYETEADSIQTLEENQVVSMLNREETYVWSILYRDFCSIENTSYTFGVFIYAIESPATDENSRSLLVQWVKTPQKPPVENMPDVNGLIISPTFKDLRNLISNDDVQDVKEIQDNISNFINNNPGAADFIDDCFVAAEYNASKLFNLNTERTYDEQTKAELDAHSTKLKHSVEAANSLYV